MVAAIPAIASRATAPISNLISVPSFPSSQFELATSCRRVSRVDNHVVDFADAVATAMFGGVTILLGLKALDRLLETREFDDDMTMKVFRTFHLTIPA